jgi:hypothetical protein
MRSTDIQVFKKIASKNFKLGSVEFISFTDIGKADLTHKIENEDTGETAVLSEADLLDIFAELRIKYEGNPPESYRVLNAMIMDWVDANEGDLKKIINPKLIPFLNKEYADIDTSDLEEDFDDYIWEDQVDYHPQIEEKSSEIYFTLELVLNIEEEEE